MTDLQIPSEYVHPGELAAFPANSNTHSPQNVEELAESRRKFSQYKNVVTWMTDKEMTVTLSDGSEATLKPGIKYVIAGEGFWKASIKRRDPDIEIKDFSHLTYEEALLLAETDNASPLGSKIDPAQMLANLDRARDLYVDNPRLAKMLERAREQAGAVEGEGKEQPDIPPAIDKADELQEKWQVKTGDLWQIGQHRLLCGDSREAGDVERVCGGEKVEAIVTDPPYEQKWLSNHYGPNRSAPNPMGKLPGDDKPRPEMLLPSLQYLNGALYVCTRWQQSHVWIKFIQEHIPVRNLIIWHKNNWSAGDLTGAYGFMYEQVIFASVDGHKLQGKRLPDVWEFDRVPPNLHPTEKPVGLMAKCISKSTLPNDLVLDPFAGSGTVAIAAEQQGRRSALIEKLPKYCAVILQRMTDTGLTPERLEA